MTAEIGSNRIVGTDPAAILGAYRETMEEEIREARAPAPWDGHAGERIVKILLERLW